MTDQPHILLDPRAGFPAGVTPYVKVDRMSKKIRVSWNARAYFELTEAGVEYLRAYYNELFKLVPADNRAEWVTSALVAAQSGSMQLWEMASIFGAELHLGGQGPQFFTTGTVFELELD